MALEGAVLFLLKDAGRKGVDLEALSPFPLPLGKYVVHRRLGVRFVRLEPSPKQGQRIHQPVASRHRVLRAVLVMAHNGLNIPILVKISRVQGGRSVGAGLHLMIPASISGYQIGVAIPVEIRNGELIPPSV